MNINFLPATSLLANRNHSDKPIKYIKFPTTWTRVPTRIRILGFRNLSDHLERKWIFFIIFIQEINFIFLPFIEVWTQWVSCKVIDTQTLYKTHCVHTSMNVMKMKFTLCFHIVFVHSLWSFDVNLAKQLAKKVINRPVWLFYSTAVSMTRCQLNVTSANELFYLSVTSLTSNVMWTNVVHRCMNLVGPK